MTTNTSKKNATIFLLIGIALLLIYGVASVVAMNHFWKFAEAEQMGSLPFAELDTETNFESGKQYLIVSLVALAGCMVMSVIYLRKSAFRNGIVLGIIAIACIGAGIYFQSLGQAAFSYENYLNTRYFPYLAITQAGLFGICSITLLLKKKPSTAHSEN